MYAKGAFQEALNAISDVAAQLESLKDKLSNEHEHEVTSLKTRNHRLRVLLEDAGGSVKQQGRRSCSKQSGDSSLITSQNNEAKQKRHLYEVDASPRGSPPQSSRSLVSLGSQESPLQLPPRRASKPKTPCNDSSILAPLGDPPQFPSNESVAFSQSASSEFSSILGIAQPPDETQNAQKGIPATGQDIDIDGKYNNNVDSSARFPFLREEGAQTNQDGDEADQDVTIVAPPGCTEDDIDDEEESAEGEECSSDEEDIFEVRKAWDVDCGDIVAIMRRAQSFGVKKAESAKHMGFMQMALRSKASLIKGRGTEGKIAGRCSVLHPQSTRRLAWDCVAMILLTYDLAMIPLAVFELPSSTFFETMDLTILIYWTLDIGMSCITGIYVNSRVVMEMRQICYRYARGWLAFDVLILTPEWLTTTVGDDSADSIGLARALRTTRFLRFLRFLRLLRVVKLEKVIHDLQGRVNNQMTLLAIAIGRLTTGVFFTIHILACAWYAIGKASPNGWVYAEDLHHKDFGNRYLYAFQWSMARLHPSSYGKNLLLESVPERIFAIVVSLFALGGGGVFISSITNTMAQMQAFRQARTRKLHMVREYVHCNNISLELSVRVKKYVEKTSGQKFRLECAAELASFLPSSLVCDLRYESWAPLISIHRFFLTLCSKHPRMIWSLCKDAFTEMTTLATETVFAFGDNCKQMVVVSTGELAYNLGRKRLVGETCARLNNVEEAPVSAGQFVSEPVLWTHWVHRGQFMSCTDSTLLSLVADKLVSVTQEHERALIDIGSYALRFVQTLNKNKDTISDIVPASLIDEVLSQVTLNGESLTKGTLKMRSTASRDQ